MAPLGDDPYTEQRSQDGTPLLSVAGGGNPEQLASFDWLPLELRLKCLANCDWQTLSRASCVSRATHALVSYLVRTPYWRTHTEEQPAVLCTDFATHDERKAACKIWALTLAAKLCGHGTPDICFVFVSAKSHSNLEEMLRALRASLASCTVLAGIVAPGVLGRDEEGGGVREVDDPEAAGLVVSVLHLPPGSTVQAALVREKLPPPPDSQDWQAPEGELPEGPSQHPRTWLVLSDRHAWVDALLQELGERFPGEAVCGGMGGGADGLPSLIVGLPGRHPGQPLHAKLTSGTLLLAISGPGVEAVPLSARGMRCISQRFMVSQVSPRVDMPPVGPVTLVQQLQNCVALATGADRLTWVPVGSSFTPTSALVAALQAQGALVAPRAPLFFGMRRPGASRREDDPCRMVMLQMHDPNNLMRTSGYVSVQHPVERGALAAFYTPQPERSRGQLAARLAEAVARLVEKGAGDRSSAEDAELEEQGPAGHYHGHIGSRFVHSVLSAPPAPVHGCLLFSCVAKGRRYYEEADVESWLVQSALPGAPLAGFFCNGEVGPSPPDELAQDEGPAARMMGYSTVACLLKLTPPPPLPSDWAPL